MRNQSKVAPGWWDYTTLDRDILDAAARLTERDILALSRPGFTVRFYETLQEFYAAEALEYIEAWMKATPERPAGICGPIGPTEQLPIVAQIVNAIGLDLRNCHFWGMDEWVVDGKAVGRDFPLGFQKADRELCFDRIRPELRMPDENLHFPDTDTAAYCKSWEARARRSTGPSTIRPSAKEPRSTRRRRPRCNASSAPVALISTR